MNKKQLLEFSEKYAKSQGFKLNPNKKITNKIIEGLLANEKKYGFRYCPCRALTGNKKEDAKKICPCFWHKQEIKDDGKCLCGLFVKGD